VGAVVTISGTNFSTTPTDNQVSFNGIIAIVTASTSTTMTVIVPSSALTGPVSITVSGVTITSSSNFTVLASPVIADFTPSGGAVGAAVAIIGTNFSPMFSNNVIMFNGASAMVTASTSTSIITTVPAGATTGKISLTLNGITVTSPSDFTVLPTPTITGFSPLRGAAGATVTITGTNFNTTMTDNVVKFNDVAAVVTESTSTSITTTVPAGATTGKITITVNGVTIISAATFTVMPSPSITNFNPLTGIVGTIVNITGINFSSEESDISVSFNGTVSMVEASSPTLITTTVPIGATTGPIAVTIYGVTIKTSKDFTVSIIDTDPPLLVIDNTFPEVIQGASLLISAQFKDPESDVINASVTFQSVTKRTESLTTTMLKSGDNWEATIPSGFIGELGIEYKLHATNGKGLIYNSESFILVNVRIPGNGLTIPYSSYGNSIVNYKIISVPLDLDKPSVSDVFDELPVYDKTKWRISHYEGTNNSNLELLPTSSLQPGIGYWLLIKDDPGIPLTTGTGKTVDVQPAFTLSLKAGWNQIGNPYNFNLLWSDLVSANPGLPISFRSYNGSIQNFENKTTLNVLEGGFVNVPIDMPLVFPVKKNTGSRISDAPTVLENPIDQNEWEVDFNITQGDISNVIGGLGMRSDASEGFDIYDGFSMPHFDKFLEVNHNKKLNNFHYSKDVIPTAESYTWNFRVDASNPENPASISWNNSYFGTNDFNLVLFDEAAKVWVDMKQYDSYSFTAPTTFKVIYGSEKYVSKEIGMGDVKIIEVSPNPSSGPISIHLFLPDWQKKFPVQLELKSLTGITLANIFSGELDSGYQKFEWSGESNSTRLPSGVYLLQMRCNNSVQTVRVLLLN
jgi:IPT/TIG domain